MESYKEKIKNCIEHLNSIRFPGNDWKEDAEYFDSLEKEFSKPPEDEETKVLFESLKELIGNKRADSLNMNKTSEELYAGWND